MGSESRVLVAEDSRATGLWLIHGLKHCGLDTEWVSTPEAAMHALEEKLYHAVVSDIFLDESMEGGIRFINQVRKREIPVIVMTAHVDLAVARECLQVGVSRFMEKPFAIDDLVQSISEAWENPRGLSTIVERFLETHGLTETEKKISRLVLKGLSNREVAEVSGSTEKTVKFHMTVIYHKCSVGSRGEFFNSIFPI